MSTTKEALNRLLTTKAWYTEAAIYVAVQILLRREPFYSAALPHMKACAPDAPQTTHTYAIRKAMEATGLLDGHRGKMMWLGAAVKAASDVLVPTGEMYSYSSSDEETGRSVHERTIKVWKLRDGALTARIKMPVAPPDIQAALDAGAADRAAVVAAHAAAVANKST